MRKLKRCISILLFVAVAACTSPRTKATVFELSVQENATNSPKAAITDLYPTSDVLPENLLRFYVYFSQPMQRENVLSSISLVDERGEVVNGAFLENRFNLWSPNGTRLTLLFDPGRVKTGLVAHNTMGRALQANQKYELVIDSSLLSADGIPMEAVHRKPFRVVDADFDAPDVKRWQLTAPKRGTKDALSISLNGPQDHVSLAYRIRVKDAENQTVPGRIELAKGESIWRFLPERLWAASDYRVVVDPLLEDIAGNRLTGLFEQPFVKDKSLFKKARAIVFQPVQSDVNQSPKGQ